MDSTLQMDRLTDLIADASTTTLDRIPSVVVDAVIRRIMAEDGDVPATEISAFNSAI